MNFVLGLGHFSTSSWGLLHLGALHPPKVPWQITYSLQGAQILVSKQKSHYFSHHLVLQGKGQGCPAPEGPSRATSYSAFVDSDLGLISQGKHLVSQV